MTTPKLGFVLTAHTVSFWHGSLLLSGAFRRDTPAGLSTDRPVADEFENFFLERELEEQRRKLVAVLRGVAKGNSGSHLSVPRSPRSPRSPRNSHRPRSSSRKGRPLG